MSISRHRASPLLLLLFSFLVLGGTKGAHAGEVFLKASLVTDQPAIFLSDIVTFSGHNKVQEAHDVAVLDLSGPTILSAEFVRRSLIGTPYSNSIIVGGPVVVADRDDLISPLMAIAEELDDPFGVAVVSGMEGMETTTKYGKVILRPDRFGNSSSMKVTLYPELREKGAISAQLTFFEYNAMAIVAIERGREITPDTYVYEVTPSVSAARWVSEGARYKALRTIAPGETIQATAVGKILDVSYGQRLRATLQKGAISLTMQAIASGSGVIGETVSVRIIETGKRIQALILSEGEVYALLP